MSLYVQVLLAYKEEIKNSVYSEVFDSELYDDLLTVEKKITELYQERLISDYDLIIINCVASNKSFRLLEKKYKISRLKLSTDFKNICAKIAFYLDSSFSDEGYMKKLKQKYHLTDEQVLKLFRRDKR